MAKERIGVSFAGRDCEALGLTLRAFPVRGVAAAGGQGYRVVGGEGERFLPDGGAEPVELALTLETEAGEAFSPAEAGAWLSGEGFLVFSDRPDRGYWARVAGEVEVSAPLPGYGLRRVQVRFVCSPYLYHLPAVNEFSCTNGGTVVNPGSGASRPRVRVAGTGAGTVTIGGEMMEISNIGGLLYIDSDAMEATDGGGNLRNDRLTMDEFPLLAPGVNYVQWSGGVTDVRILPRYRDRA